MVNTVENDLGYVLKPLITPIRAIHGHLSPRSSMRLSSQQQRNVMADKKCAVGLADYVQLHSLSSFVFYDTSSKKLKRGKFYNVEAVKDKTCKIL